MFNFFFVFLQKINKIMLLEIVLYILAFFTSLLWISKLTLDFVSAIFGGNFSDENAKKDGVIRLVLTFLVSLFWTLIIIFL